jgi:hypothetical protein
MLMMVTFRVKALCAAPCAIFIKINQNFNHCYQLAKADLNLLKTRVGNIFLKTF